MQVVLSVFVKNVKEEDLTVDLAERSVRLRTWSADTGSVDVLTAHCATSSFDFPLLHAFTSCSSSTLCPFCPDELILPDPPPRIQLSLNIKLPNDSEIAFDIDPLARSIDVSRSTHRVLSMKLEFKLAKKQAGARWTALEGDEEPADANTSTPAAPSTSSSTPNHAYPSSSKTKKNWDALAADFEKKEADEQAKRKDDKDANAGGDKELNELFKSLYAGATDDRESDEPRDGTPGSS